MSALREAYKSGGKDPEEQIAQLVYQALQQDPIVAENRFRGFFTDMGAMLNEFTEGVNNGEQGLDRGSELGNDALGAGGEGTRNEAGARRGAVDAGDEVGQRRDRVAHYGVKEEVTPASLGITNGGTAQRVQVLDESTFEAGSPEAQAAQRARQMGLEPVFVRGTMEVGGKQVRGYIQGSRVILQADGKYSADQILQHEEYHDASRRNPQLNRTVRKALANNFSEQELGDLVSRYITAYDGVYDFSGMTQAEIEALIEEELFADLYAGIDNTGRDTLREDARRGYAQAQQEQGQNAEAQQDATGPPEGRASLSNVGELYLYGNNKTLAPATARERSVFDRSFANQTGNIKPGESKTIFITTADYFYVVEANGYMSGMVMQKIAIDGNEEEILDIRRRIKDARAGWKTINDRGNDETWGDRRRNRWHDASSQNQGATQKNDSMAISEQDSVATGDDPGLFGYPSEDELRKAIENGVMIVDDNGYLLNFGKESPNDSVNIEVDLSQNGVTTNPLQPHLYAEYVARRELADRLADRLEAAEDRSIRSTVQRLRRRRGIDAALEYLAGEVAARRIPSDEATEIYNELTGQEQ